MSMISTNEGLFSKTKYATEQYNNGTKKEAEAMDDLMSILIDIDTTIENILSPLTPTREAKLRLAATEGYMLQYQIGESDWEYYKAEVSITQNGYVGIRLKDSAGHAGNTRTINVKNIDRIPPTVEKVTFSGTNHLDLGVTVQVSDQASEGAGTDIAGVKEIILEFYSGQNLVKSFNLQSNKTISFKRKY